MEQVSPELARRYLADIDPPWRSFWFHMHLMARNLREFAHGLGVIDDDVFTYHVSGQKNDLARWVREVVGDAYLAAALDEVHSKEEALVATEARLKELEAAAKSA